ncbi:MAG: NAD(P)/FAD-dependent oxidoreductase [Planctomycetota bacterium]
MVVIAGAGVIGASVACHLAERGERVVVVEREAEPGLGSTGKATGGFRTHFATEINTRLSLLSRPQLDVQAAGYLFLAETEPVLAMLRGTLTPLTQAREVTPDEIAALNPFCKTVRGGLFSPEDGFIRPMEILRGYLDRARDLGVEFRYGEEASRFDIDARGAWTGPPVQPVERHVLTTVRTEILPPYMPMTVFVDDGFHLRVRDGRVLLLHPDRDRIVPRAHECVPCLRDVPLEGGWSGFYEMSPDGHALLGFADGVLRVNGSSGHGVMHAPALGRLAAELWRGEPASIDVTALRPDRFTARDAIEGATLL